MIKSAFTLAEALITITIVGIVMAIAIPVLNNTKPNKDIILYKKAIYTTTKAMNNIMESSSLKDEKDYWASSKINENEFCIKFADEINTLGKIRCEGDSNYNNPNFVTTDGLRFWGFEGKKFNAKKQRIVYVDRKLTDNEKRKLSKTRDADHSSPGLKLVITYDGIVFTPDTNEYKYEAELTDKFVSVK